MAFFYCHLLVFMDILCVCQHPKRCHQPDTRHPGLRTSGQRYHPCLLQDFGLRRPVTPVTTAIDIKGKDAKCGAPSAGSPKVFFKYFYLNTATGEKSGEVLAQAKLSE